MTSALDAGPALPMNAWLRFDVLRGPLSELPRSRVLEVGPGSGAIAARLAGAGHEYVAVEMSDESRQRTKSLLEQVPGADARVVASFAEIDDEPFEVLCAFEVLEHIDDDLAALTEWVQHLGPDATVLLSAPAWQKRMSEWDHEVGHLRRYDPADFQRLASNAGLVDVRVVVYGFGLGNMLEKVRNLIARRRQQQTPVESESALDRTKRSGRLLQPPAWMNRAVQVATWPFRVIQRRFPGRGTGLVLIARTPSNSSEQ